jgi:very-short-patch-repair endonuclease
VFSADDRWRDATTSGHGWQALRFVRDDVVLSRRRTVDAVRQVLAYRTSSSTRGWPTS